MLLVIGSEATACPGWSGTTATCWRPVPISSKVESLNASVAASIALYAIEQARTQD